MSAPRILLAAPMSRLGDLPQAATALRALIPEARVVNPTADEWTRVREVEGGWRGMEAWAAREHEALVLIPAGGPVRADGHARWPLSRACFGMARDGIMRGRGVFLLVRSGGKAGLREVQAVTLAAGGERDRDWKGCYGWALVRGAGAEEGADGAG